LDAIYARQSVDKADSLSIKGQIELCKKQISGEFKIYQDKGYSGKNTNRPSFKKMMDDVEKGIIKKIVVYRLDRFSRSIADFGRLWEILKQHDVEFVSVNETFDTSTPMGRAMLNIIMVFAQLERETTAERVRDNYYQRAALGSWPGGPAPYGFEIGRIKGSEGKLVPGLIPSPQIEIVARIYREYAMDTATLGSVARSLNEDNIPAPKRSVWDSVSLSRLLHSPLYVMADEDVFLYYRAKGMIFTNPLEDFDGIHAGMITGKRDRSVNKYRDLKDQHFSLAVHHGVIPSELWLKCQYKLDKNRQVGCTGKGKHTWLSGLMKCAACGYSIKVNRDRDKYYLTCSGRSNLGICASSIKIQLRDLENSIAGELEKILGECPDIEAETITNQELSDKIEHIDRKIENLIEALSEGSDVTMAYINKTIKRLEKERMDLLDNQNKQRNHSKTKLKRLKFESLTFEHKKSVAAQFIKEIHLGSDSAEVIWNI